MLRSLRALPLAVFPLLVIAATVHCGTDRVDIKPPVDSGPPITENDAGPKDTDPPLVPASKVDLLLVVDNSATMGDKQAVIAGSVGTLIRRLVQPRCVDASDRTKVVGASADGKCATGVLEHQPIADLHVGVISSSLGGATDPNWKKPICDGAGNPRLDDHAHLLNAAKGGGVVPSAAQGFIHFATNSAPNTISDPNTLEGDTSKLILGVDQTGCGLEAQLESMYRFLIEPDPPMSIGISKDVKGTYVGVDDVLLKQRKAFLRPDSAVAIVMITDEDDSYADPRAFDGRGFAFSMRDFPGSKIFRGTENQGTTAPRGTSACSVDPGSADCTSCFLQDVCEASDATCQKIKSDPNCTALGAPPRGSDDAVGYAGYYGPDDDSLGVRFHRMKERFGVDPQFPIQRYVRGLSSRKVPNRTSDHAKDGTYVDAETCTNPLFAKDLPASSGEELCNREEGTRSRQLVFFGLIGGVPKSLAAPIVTDWTKVVGANPDAYDYSGMDPHMIPSVAPRPGLPPPSAIPGDLGPDPEHGREWDTQKAELQYACTFDLPAERTCAGTDPSCDCGREGSNPPLCKGPIVNGQGTNVRAKAHPTTRELRLVKALGDRGVAGSICNFDKARGYGAMLDVLANRMAPTLAK